MHPWPFADPNELPTSIFDASRTVPLFAGSSEGPKVDITVRSNTINGQISSVKNRLLDYMSTRTRWFEWGGERYEWRYIDRHDWYGMVLQRPVTDKDDSTITTPGIVINDRILPTAPQSPRYKGKGKCKAKEGDKYVSIARFKRGAKVNKEGMGIIPAGQGGWVIAYDEMKGGTLVLPHWLLLATCMVMLKRVRERKALQVTGMVIMWIKTTCSIFRHR